MYCMFLLSEDSIRGIDCRGIEGYIYHLLVGLLVKILYSASEESKEK